MTWPWCCSASAAGPTYDQADASCESSLIVNADRFSSEVERSWRKLENVDAIHHGGKLLQHSEFNSSPASPGALLRKNATSPCLDGVPLKRKNKRHHTEPTMESLADRHSSITLSKTVLANLLRQQNSRRADAFDILINAKTEYVVADELERTWSEQATCHVHGSVTGVGAHKDKRGSVFSGSTQFPGKLPPCISCQKGNKGGSAPNQDNFSITYFANGYSLVGVFDGHGEWGHLVSARIAQTVPYFFIRSSSFPSSIEKALVEAFERAHDDVVALALTDNWNVMARGTTGVAAVWKGNKVWTANCGDSRCVVSSVREASKMSETEDHKLELPKEKARIVAAGGRIKEVNYGDGFIMYRVYMGHEDYPGLAMARALGDVCVKGCGVIASPQIGFVEVDLSKRAFMVLSSDGVWEFMSSSDVVNCIVEKIDGQGGVEHAISELHTNCMKMWEEEEGGYCDDVTTVLIQLENEQEEETQTSAARTVSKARLCKP